ncbi:hypothetical protein B5M09_001874 [Aphanomyces astaci]|nr:hypothetical protein B5M09_001874 [Aphanomyces astaci]
MGFFSLGVVSMIALDYRFRKLVATKDKASAVSLVGIVLVCAVESFAVAAFNGDVSPFHTLFKPIQDPTDDGATIVKAVMVKDLVLRLASLGIKAMIGLVGTRASTATSYRRQQRMYEAIEVLTLCVRSIVSTFLWVIYYQSVHLKLSAQVLYVGVKGFVTARAVAPYHLKFGSPIAECCICFDAIPSPRACAHMLCRECAVECDNNDRVASCHHCRRGPATKHTSCCHPKYGGSSPLPEFF